MMSISDTLGLIANIIAVGGIPFTVYQIIKGRDELKKNQEKQKTEEDRKNKEIRICLKGKESDHVICLPNKIRRGELTRAEVMGRLGMVPMKPDPQNGQNKQRRFEMKRNATEEFIKSIDILYVSSNKTELIINCETEEMKQFDIDEIKKLGFEVAGFD